MLPLSRRAIDCSQSAELTWQSIADQVVSWAIEQGCALRDCVALVPQAPLLAPARAAFARRGGWMPRVETLRTLSRGLGPQPEAAAPGPSFDSALDYLAMHQLLVGQAWGRAWSQRDPVGFDRGISSVVRTAHDLARAAHAHQPAARATYWSRVREVLGAAEGYGGHERRLARVAAEWAALAQATTDRLFGLRPAGWVALSVAGRDSLTTNLLDAAAERDVPCLLLEVIANVEQAERFNGQDSGAAELPSVQQFICDDFEHEAQIAAAQTLRWLEGGIWPVALIAQDRVLVRRIRALLDREAVSMTDETGWKLSTTRAAARVMTLLRAARPGASSDDWLDWVKTGLEWPELPARATVSALRLIEAEARRRRLVPAADLGAARADSGAKELFACAQATLAPLAQQREAALGAWLMALGAALRSCGVFARLGQDVAGQQVLAALRLDAGAATPPDDAALAVDGSIALPEFTRWVDLTLESRTFLPAAGGRTESAQVIITPMAQAVLRPFRAIVLPGADARRLGAPAAAHPLLSEAQLAALDLAGAERERAAQAAAFEHLVVQAPVVVSRRLQDEGSPLGESPVVEHMALRLRRRGRLVSMPGDPRLSVDVWRYPTQRSAPRAPALVPRRLSASGFEALRDCPYRFFSRAMLRLRETEEIARDLEKRDYGSWLHQVLHTFHLGRGSPQAAPAEEARLNALADELQTRLRLDAAEFLPFRASFRALVPRYVVWLHQRDQQGWCWTEGEFHAALDLPEPIGITLEGQIDRVDAVRGVGAEAMQLIDYKTGNLDGLRRRVSEPLEDTQLAFYAALLPARPTQDLRAGYLALDGKRIEWVEHREVARSAAALVGGLGDEIVRLRNGAALLPLGEGQTCERCEVRGLCRRDDWAADYRDPR